MPSPPAGPVAGTRRALLLAGLGLPMLARPAHAVSGPFADGASLLIAGPAGGRLDRAADILLPPLLRALPAGVRLHRVCDGGADGVTGANQFGVRGVPDGASLLLMPGSSAIAWLIGDPRAHFDAGSLVTVMAGVVPGVLMSRRPVQAIGSAQPLRFAAGRPDGPELAGLLALDLLGLSPVPAFGFPDPATVEQVILANGADAAFVIGADAPRRIERLSRAGLAPVFTLGVPGTEDAVLRDPLMPEVPSLPELAMRLRGSPPAGPLFDAWRAVAVAAQLEFVLALPALTPAALVSLWREAALRAAPQVSAPELARERLLACPDANQFTAPISAAGMATLLALRQWLAERLRWQPA
jgi:hypothetical protein